MVASRLLVAVGHAAGAVAPPVLTGRADRVVHVVGWTHEIHDTNDTLDRRRMAYHDDGILR